MLFNSYVFLLAFLPTVLAAYHGLRLAGRTAAAKLFLVAASLFFYGWWDYRYVALITASIGFNYAISFGFERWKKAAKAFLITGLVFNLALLGWYKYAGFFAEAVGEATGLELGIRRMALPLAISFFTFQQISYLVEAYKDRKRARHIVDYCLFVLFFPHLIAGPITHHKEMLPQFAAMGTKRLPSQFLKVGASLLILGLGKKVLIADTLASIANPIFHAAAKGTELSGIVAWLGALAYTFQLYFDFSGYSDMAIGLALLFGIRMPVNFASPYRSTSIIEFWRRWHISLSRFLRNYLYIPLGGNRNGPLRRYANLIATMALGGLWHGAGWTFIVWGLLHGFYLVVNHLWRGLTGRRRAPALAAHDEPGPVDPLGRRRVGVFLGSALTFIAVVVAWVLFRAETFGSAMAILRSMALDPSLARVPGLASSWADWAGVLAAAGLAFLAPNSQEIAGYPHHIPDAQYERDEAPIRDRLWKGSPVAAAALLGVILAVVLAKLPDPGVFLYFNF